MEDNKNPFGEKQEEITEEVKEQQETSEEVSEYLADLGVSVEQKELEERDINIEEDKFTASTIGKYNFMMLYYGTANVEKVVYDFLMVSDAINLFYSDFAEHGFTGEEGKDFYQNLLDAYTVTFPSTNTPPNAPIIIAVLCLFFLCFTSLSFTPSFVLLYNVSFS